MQKYNEKLVFSPSDLTLFMDSPFASWMERYRLEFPDSAPAKDLVDPLMVSLQQRGFAHEDQEEANFRADGLSVVKIDGGDNEDKQRVTLSAMRQGADVIVQARLEGGRFAGFADFLVKVPGTSNLGDYHYEVWDTKLTKSLKPAHVLQLCAYAEMLEGIQGVRPKHITVALGRGEKRILNTDDYFHYYQGLKRNFFSIQDAFDPDNMPDPADSKTFGNWSNYAEGLLKERDHLFQVASISRSQIKKLNRSNILSMQQLADCDFDRVPGIHIPVFQRLKAQSSIQKASAGLSAPLYQVLVPQNGERQGLTLLPPSSPLDVFFDIEGSPLIEGGLEYLWGCTYFDDEGKRAFRDFWAHDSSQEKKAFKEFIQWVFQRWEQDPNMHIYHYANYEIAACRKLMGRYGVCEYEVDQLLRNEVFVDLYKVIKGGILLGEPRYSIKNVEHLYRGKRETEVAGGGDSVAAYEEWVELHHRGEEGDTWETSTVLNKIRDYNIDDCESTQELVDWLRERQKEHSIAYQGKEVVETPEIKEEITERLQLRDRLLDKANQLFLDNPERARLLENLAWMLEFHRRESKPIFWRKFDRLGLSDEDLLDDADCLACCERTERAPFKLSPRVKKLAYEYRFDPGQEFKGAAKKFFIWGEKDEKGKDASVNYIPDESDLENGLVVIQSKHEPKQYISLIPDEFVRPDPIPQAINQVVIDYEAGRLHDSAIVHFLTRSKPVINGFNGGSIAPSSDADEKLHQIIHAVKNLNNSYLTIQGPPGSGKSYTGKHVIAELVKMGYKIGIASNSHKAINHLLLSTARYCKDQKIGAAFACTKETEPALIEEGVAVIKNTDLAGFIKPGCVLGTTAWGYSREDMVGKLDYLFVDEAGQVAVANLIGMSRSANNLVLMGDQMQLGQPTQGSHPAESGLSILDYLLHDIATIPEDMGVFLGTTYRMHSSLNNFVSKYIYEGKLKSQPRNDRRVLEVPDNYNGKMNKEAGIVFVPVVHEGNTQASDEEVSEIVKLTKELLGRAFTDTDGQTRPLGWEDILYVTPYNHQSRKLKEALGERAKVGSVDKFQGQEAPVVFLSMCASDGTESLRGMDFLLDKHRLNVAISRAQVLAVVVGNPGLGNTVVNQVKQMELVNLFNVLCDQG